MEYNTPNNSSSPIPTSTPVNPLADENQSPVAHYPPLSYVLSQAHYAYTYRAHFLHAVASLEAISTTGGVFSAYDIHGTIQTCNVPPPFKYNDNMQIIEIKPTLYYRTMHETAGLESSPHNEQVDSSFPQGRHCMFWITALEQEVPGPNMCCGAPDVNKELRIRTGHQHIEFANSHCRKVLGVRMREFGACVGAVTQVVCINLGDFGDRGSVAACMNHVVALAVFNEICAVQFSRGRKKTGKSSSLSSSSFPFTFNSLSLSLPPRVRLLAQDPTYCPATQAILREWGFEILPGLDGYKALDGNTFVISFNSWSPEPVRQIVTGLTASYEGPAGMLCNTIDSPDPMAFESVYAANSKAMDIGSLVMATQHSSHPPPNNGVEVMRHVSMYLRADDGVPGRVEPVPEEKLGRVEEKKVRVARGEDRETRGSPGVALGKTVAFAGVKKCEKRYKRISAPGGGVKPGLVRNKAPVSPGFELGAPIAFALAKKDQKKKKGKVVLFHDIGDKVMKDPF
ncbi:hypothetical protein P280DRAFT_475661 [Massarina eburnea CBS 473.64]|uniref:SRR1-like domain-containing protein n=1 Tax=Massarina eburnea CBS 473.64 TaxID=1395130 RepID=A0A6A6SG06_9PLEO|nr:hypothetical protein P280DRAFT_475661 [Massarina eburnea CBS 473.64]